MTKRYSSEEAKQRILSACVRLFLEQGYSNTTVSEILKASEVSSSTFQNIFRTKDRILIEFVGIMFSNQFTVAKSLAKDDLSPVLVYAIETAVQLALTEINDNLCDIYVEAYTYPETAKMIQRKTTDEVMHIFGPYVPDFSESDFYEVEIGLSGIMRNYMANKCDMYFTLERKLKRFISMSLSLYNVPKPEQEKIIGYVMKTNVESVAAGVMHNLFDSLAMKYELM